MDLDVFPTFVIPDKNSYPMEHVRTVLNIPNNRVKERNVEQTNAILNRIKNYQKMEDVNTAAAIHMFQKTGKGVSRMFVTNGKR